MQDKTKQAITLHSNFNSAGTDFLVQEVECEFRCTPCGVQAAKVGVRCTPPTPRWRRSLCQLPQRGPGRSPGRPTIVLYFKCSRQVLILHITSTFTDCFTKGLQASRFSLEEHTKQQHMRLYMTVYVVRTAVQTQIHLLTYSSCCSANSRRVMKLMNVCKNAAFWQEMSQRSEL